MVWPLNRNHDQISIDWAALLSALMFNLITMYITIYITYNRTVIKYLQSNLCWRVYGGFYNMLSFFLLENKVWTTMKNNLSPQTSVTTADQEGKAVLQITYNVTDEQVHHDHVFIWSGLPAVHFAWMCYVWSEWSVFWWVAFMSMVVSVLRCGIHAHIVCKCTFKGPVYKI